ncbi:29576_t:CDS:2, partial [Gigaspora margarita]
IRTYIMQIDNYSECDNMIQVTECHSIKSNKVVLNESNNNIWKQEKELINYSSQLELFLNDYDIKRLDYSQFKNHTFIRNGGHGARLSLEAAAKEITNNINSLDKQITLSEINNWLDFNNSFESYLSSSSTTSKTQTSSTFQFIDLHPNPRMFWASNLGLYKMRILLKMAENQFGSFFEEGIMQSFEQRLSSIGIALIEAFLLIKKEPKEEFLLKCLVRCLMPNRKFKNPKIYDLLYSQLGNNHKKIFSDAMNFILKENHDNSSWYINDNTIKKLRFSHTYYTWCLNKFQDTKIIDWCFEDILNTRISVDKYLRHNQNLE